MALPANTVLEVRTGGSDTNGGGFVTGSSGTDWSQQNTAQYSVTDGVTNATTTITSATANFGTDVVGNLIYVQGGTGSVVAGWYQIVSRTNNTTIVVDRSTGLTAGTGVTLHIGGALASPGQAAAIANVVGMITFIKYTAATPFVITTASYNVSGGCCQPTAGTYIAGYDTTRAIYTPFQNRPTIQLNAGVTSATIYQNLNAAYMLQSVILDANSQTGSICSQFSGEGFFVKAMNFTSKGMATNSDSSVLILCEVTGGTSVTVCMNASFAWGCVVHDNTMSVANLSAFSIAHSAVNCIAYNNNQDGFAFTVSQGVCLINCVAYNNSARGYYFGNVSGNVVLVNCIAEANGTYGYFVNSGVGQLVNCADYNNTSGRKNTASLWQADVGSITGSGSFFAAAGTNFGLNNTAGAGALLRAAGFPGSANPFANLASTHTFLDIGAIQHQDTGGGAAPLAPPPIIIARGTPY